MAEQMNARGESMPHAACYLSVETFRWAGITGQAEPQSPPGARHDARLKAAVSVGMSTL